jgi:hypothetical protein
MSLAVTRRRVPDRAPAAFGRTADRRVPMTLAQLGFSAVLACGLAVGLHLSTRGALVGCVAIGVMASLLKAPPLGVIAVIAAVAVLGDSGAHVLVGGLPLLESLLALATVAALARAVRRGWASAVPSMWLVPGLWGLWELAFQNRGGAISGIREALIFIYPLLFAFPLMGCSGEQVRRFLLRRGLYVCLAGWVVLCLGIYNEVTGTVGVTSSGQLRALGSWYVEPLMAAFFMSLWLYQVGRLRLWSTVLCATPIGGLLLINHRSAYLGAIAAIAALVPLRSGLMPVGVPGLRKLAVLGGIGLAILLLATPVGASGIRRFLTITSTSDPNIRDRLARDRLALPTTAGEWIIGAGVGLEATDISGRAKTSAVNDPNQTHNSFGTMLHLGGLTGLILLIAPIVRVMRRGFAAREDPLVQVLLAFALFTMVMAAFNVVLENAYFGGWFWVAVILLQVITSPDQSWT